MAGRARRLRPVICYLLGRPVITVNKLDRAFLELQLPSEDMYLVRALICRSSVFWVYALGVTARGGGFSASDGLG